MKKIKFYLEKYKLYITISIISILILTILFFILFYNNGEVTEEIVIEKKESKLEEKVVEKKEETNIKVDVKGYVQKEGVYELGTNSRVIDAINKAGGLKKGANTDYINLSKKLVDEMIIIIYSDDEVSKFKKEDREIIYIEYKCDCPDNINDSCITKEDVVNTNGVEEEKKEEVKEETKDKQDDNSKVEEDKTLVSINTASKEELMTLPGIGESKADNIIKYREEHGKFEHLEDIKKVSGIGDSAYSKIKDFIKL